MSFMLLCCRAVYTCKLCHVVVCYAVFRCAMEFYGLHAYVVFLHCAMLCCLMLLVGRVVLWPVMLCRVWRVLV